MNSALGALVAQVEGAIAGCAAAEEKAASLSGVVRRRADELTGAVGSGHTNLRFRAALKAVDRASTALDQTGAAARRAVDPGRRWLAQHGTDPPRAPAEPPVRRLAARERPGRLRNGRVFRAGGKPESERDIELGEAAEELYGEYYDSEDFYGVPFKDGKKMGSIPEEEQADYYVYDQPDLSFDGDPPGVGKGHPRSKRHDLVEEGFRVVDEEDGTSRPRRKPQGRAPRTTILSGGPASGKGGMEYGRGGVELEDGSYFEPQGEEDLPVNPDDVSVELPDSIYLTDLGGNGRSAVHEEASTLSKRITTNGLRDGYDMFIDIVGGGAPPRGDKPGKFEGKVQEAIDAGHEVQHIHVLQDREVARKLARDREEAAREQFEEARRAGAPTEELKPLRRSMRGVEDSVLDTGHKESSASTLRMLGDENGDRKLVKRKEGGWMLEGAQPMPGVTTRVYHPVPSEAAKRFAKARREGASEEELDRLRKIMRGDRKLVAYTTRDGQVIILSKELYALLRQKAVA